nr:penicillin acylase family protein [Oceanococcus sp. HetDA_MAG_MS8]
MPTFVLAILASVLLSACNSGGRPSADQPSEQAPSTQDAFEWRAVNVLAPGQSGDFGLTEFVQDQALGPLIGTDPSVYGPHVDDQRPLYWLQQFKDGKFLDITDRQPSAQPRAGVSIYRDDFGVPVVYGDTLEDVWFGAGYALAQDRLFLLDAARRQARGTLAEVAGPSAVPDDVQARILTYTEAEYQAMFAALGEDIQRTIEAYCAGSNARIAEVTGGQLSQLPAEFVALQYQPAPLTPSDVLAIGVLITRQVASNGGDEMANVAELQRLSTEFDAATALDIFTDVLWQDDKKATVTVPPELEFSNISTPPEQRRAVLENMAAFALDIPLDLAQGPGTGDFPQPEPLLPVKSLIPHLPDLRVLPERISASYQVVLDSSRTVDGSTLLISGPQLGYSYPSLLAELEVHGAGFDARGTTVPGLPVIGIGYTERTAWALTTGESKTIDSFIEELADNPNEYRHQGEIKAMDCRSETVRYRQSLGPLPAGPALASVEIQACRTVHGPVVARSADGRFARSVQYGMWMREVETAEAILEWSRANTFAEFDATMPKATWNENLMYADADGNIAYYHPGLHPRRHPGTDQRLPIPGTGEFDHDGLLSFSELPQVRNPARGWLANWNNKPAIGWGDGTGGDASQLPAGSEGRITNWDDLLRNNDQLSFDQLLEFDRLIGRKDPRARALVPIYLRLQGQAELTDLAQQALARLAAWDQDHYNPAIDVDDPAALDRPGETIFDALVQATRKELTQDILGPDFQRRHNIRGTHPYDAGTFDRLFVRIFSPDTSSITPRFDWLQGRSQSEFLAAVLASAITELVAEYGEDIDQWRRIHARSPINNLTGLIGPSLDMPHQDRGTWIHVIGYIPAKP